MNGPIWAEQLPQLFWGEMSNNTICRENTPNICLGGNTRPHLYISEENFVRRIFPPPKGGTPRGGSPKQMEEWDTTTLLRGDGDIFFGAFNSISPNVWILSPGGARINS